MKLRFENGKVARYSFRDLEYGLYILSKNLDRIERRIQELKQKDKSQWELQRLNNEKIPIENKIKIVEDEMSNRILTDNANDWIYRKLLGVNYGQ